MCKQNGRTGLETAGVFRVERVEGGKNFPWTLKIGHHFYIYYNSL